MDKSKMSNIINLTPFLIHPDPSTWSESRIVGPTPIRKPWDKPKNQVSGLLIHVNLSYAWWWVAVPRGKRLRAKNGWIIPPTSLQTLETEEI
jgi:hypothetical protein